VRADALADGVPLRDLYLTRGHSLLFDDVLIPVEYLINGRSILWDETAAEVEFFHIELQDHDILLAEDATAESYRDDGNRHLFDNLDRPRFAAANMPHYAPVLTGGAEVDLIWRELLDRSGFVPPETTDDPDLHLVADGQRINAFALDGGHNQWQGTYRFRLERVPRELTVVSRSASPMQMGIGRDSRCVGVAVHAMRLRNADCTIEVGYDSCWLRDGFNNPEPQPRYRWTTGEARAPGVWLALFKGWIELSITVVCTSKYPAASSIAAYCAAA